MKISQRIPSIGAQESSEKEIQGQKKTINTKSAGIASPVDRFEGPDSIQKLKIESAVNIYEGPKSISPELKNESRVEQLIGYDKNPRRNDQFQDPSIPDFPDGTSTGRGLLGDIGSFLNGFLSDSQKSQIGSRVNKYEGPNSLPLPEIESKAHSYKGPGSIELSQRSSKADQYQGPDSITRPRTRPHVDLTVPGKNKDGYSQSSEPSIPDFTYNNPGRGLFGDLTGIHSSSSDPEVSSARTSADKYTGPDSLKRAEIESEVEKYKGPKSLFDERGSRVEKYKGPDSIEPHEDK